MTFISSYDKTERAFMPESDGLEPIYEKQVDKFGAVSYVDIGKKRNLYEEIQSYKDDCDINFIVSRCLKDGSLSLLADDGKHSLDVSNIPDNFLDLWNMTQRLSSEFETLPVDEREAFNNSALLYIDSRINGTAQKIVSDFKASKQASESEVKADA